MKTHLALVLLCRPVAEGSCVVTIKRGPCWNDPTWHSFIWDYRKWLPLWTQNADFSATVSTKTKLPSHMGIDSKPLCQNTEPLFQHFPCSIRKSPVHISKHPCHQTIRIISISYAATLEFNNHIYGISTRSSRRSFRKPSTVSNLIHRVTEDHNLSRIGEPVQIPVPGREAFACVWPPHISPSPSPSLPVSLHCAVSVFHIWLNYCLAVSLLAAASICATKRHEICITLISGACQNISH